MKNLFILVIIGLAMTGTVLTAGGNNPLLQPFNTPFNVPPFDKIKMEHYKPAFEEAIKVNEKEIDAIVNNSEKPNFKNTIEALEYSGDLLNTISTIFFNLSETVTNDEFQAIAEDVTPMLSKHSDNISLNVKLFQRVKDVYSQKSKLKLTPEQKVLLEETYKDFVRSGANLDEKKKEQLRKINEELSLLTLKFGDNVLKETNKFQLLIDNKNDLAGLPQGIIDAAADDAAKAGKTGKWVFTLKNPSVMPFLQYASNRTLREKIWRAYMMRGNNGNELDNKENIRKIANLRLERAKLLGYKTYADYVLEENMAKTPKKVNELLMKLWKPALEVTKKDAGDLQKLIDKEGGKFKLEPWDWRYYAEKLRKEKYDLDEESLKPYFKLENVRDGIFTLANKLYGIKFVERIDIPKYHKEAVTYEVIDADGSHLAILYMDFFPRESKRGGAWMTNFREQYRTPDGKNVSPVVSLVCNFTKPTGDTPSLLTADEVETFFHEFGHGLHGMFSKCTFRSIAGTNVSRDFVELPSQVMENWVFEPEMLALYAKHYKTGQVIPEDLVKKIKNSSLFNQGFVTTEYLAASLLDMAYYTQTKNIEGDINQFEDKEMKKIGLIPEIISRYRSTYFNHIFSGGYSSGYYSYIWAAVLDTDAFQAFREHGLFDKKTADSFRNNVLSKGKTDDPMKMYKAFRGAEPSIEPLLKKRGLK